MTLFVIYQKYIEVVIEKQLQEEKEMEPKIVQKEAFTVVGLKVRCAIGQTSNIPQLWGQLMARMGKIQGLAEQGNSYGAMTNYDEAGGGWDYIAAFRVEPAAPTPAGMERVDLPAGTYAVFPCTMLTIQQTYDAIYQQWLPQSGRRHAPAPEFELYGRAFNPDDPASQFEVYIPVV